jgi:hypothetical protein
MNHPVPGARYRTLYSHLVFEKNEQALRRIADRVGLYIPFIEYGHLPSEKREPLDSYIYILADDKMEDKLKMLRKQYGGQLGISDLGLTRASQIQDLISSCEQQADHSFKAGNTYRIIHGPNTKLHVDLDAIVGLDGLVSYDLLDGSKTMVIPLSSLCELEGGVDPTRSGFRNLKDVAFAKGQKAAVIIDGTYEIHRSFYKYDRVRTREGTFVGGCLGFYFRLLYMKELYPEREIHVTFDDYDPNRFAPVEARAAKMPFTSEWFEMHAANRQWCKRLAETVGFVVHDRLEDATDVIASLATRLVELGYSDILIYARDRDLFPLVDSRITLLKPKATFRGHAEYIHPATAAQSFGVGRPDKIDWIRAITGEGRPGLISLNRFYQEKTGARSRYQKSHFLPYIEESETVDELREKLLYDLRFNDFVEDGQFDANLALLTPRRDMFKDVEGFGNTQKFSKAELESLLKESYMYKELEGLSRVARIFEGVW